MCAAAMKQLQSTGKKATRLNPVAAEHPSACTQSLNFNECRLGFAVRRSGRRTASNTRMSCAEHCHKLSQGYTVPCVRFLALVSKLTAGGFRRFLPEPGHGLRAAAWEDRLSSGPWLRVPRDAVQGHVARAIFCYVTVVCCGKPCMQPQHKVQPSTVHHRPALHTAATETPNPKSPTPQPSMNL